MSTPCRPTTCDHLQCFDASLFLMMNEKKPTWICPVCDSPAKYDDIMVDGYFEEVIKSAELPEEENEIILNRIPTIDENLKKLDQQIVASKDFHEKLLQIENKLDHFMSV